MEYIAAQSVKVAPERFLREGEKIAVAAPDDHLTLLVEQGLLIPVPAKADPVPTVEVEVETGKKGK